MHTQILSSLNFLFGTLQPHPSPEGFFHWGLLIAVYGMSFLAVMLNRKEQALLQESPIILPSGEPLSSLQYHHFFSAEKEKSIEKNAWERRLKELNWWHVSGVVMMLFCVLYGVGLIFLSQLRPDVDISLKTASYAMMNAIFLFLFLTYAFSPIRPTEQELSPMELVITENPPLREIFPARIENWIPSSRFCAGTILEYKAGLRLDYQRTSKNKENREQQEVPVSALLSTLLTSAFVAPILSGLLSGYLYIFSSLNKQQLISLFAWVSGGGTLFFALLAYAILQREYNKETEERLKQEVDHFVFDLESKNIYLEGLSKMQSCHFQQCTILLIASSSEEDEEYQSDEQVEEKELHLLIYGELFPPQGLLLASFQPQENETHNQECYRFAAMLSRETEIPLYATNKAPVV